MMLVNHITEKTQKERVVRLEGLASIGRLAVNLIHELNNPLDGIRRYLRLMLDQMSDDDPKRVYAEQIQEGLMRISSVVDGLVDLTRANTSNSGPTDIKRSIEQAVFRHRDQISAQNIKIESEFDGDIPDIVNADVGYVFMNIVKNAIQAMPNGGTLSIQARMPSPQLLEALFSDTGSGIPRESWEKIFEPFFTTKKSGQGIGLGLFISQEVVENYGGAISVKSELGKGTTFTVELPIYKGKVLVMDDEKYIRDLISGMLSTIGYRVITTVDGAEAIELCKEAKEAGRPYDAVILDLTIPGGMGGKETVQRLLAIDPGVKAIATSGYSDDPILTDLHEYGFQGALHKPYHLEDIDRVLNMVIKDTNN